MKKSPFVVLPELLSPLQCEMMVDSMNLTIPQFDEDDNVKPLVLINELMEMRLADATLQLCDIIDDHYDVSVKSVSKHRFIWYPEEYSDKKVICDNSKFMDGSWVRKNKYDFSAIIFLSDYNENPKFDDFYEVYGGRVQFPTFDFSFMPQRGHLIIYPSSDNFMYNISDVKAGDLNIIQVFFQCDEPYEHDYTKFENNYKQWDF